jgi:hypothetical protein
MKILDWYLQGLGDNARCVALWNRGVVTFELGAVTLNLKLPSALYLPNECRFWMVFAGMMYYGTKVCYVHMCDVINRILQLTA